MIVADRLKLAYFPVPKCACSSAKHALHELIHGQPYVDTSADRSMHIHKLYPRARSFDHRDWLEATAREYKTLCIVRDPMDRLRSAYAHRVLANKEINHFAVQRAGIGHLPAAPTFEEFVAHLSEYQAVPLIRHHTLPITHYLGTDSSRYDRIFAVSKMESFFSYLEEVSGCRVARQHRNSTQGRPIGSASLPRAVVDKIMAYYHNDYSVFGRYW